MLALTAAITPLPPVFMHGRRCGVRSRTMSAWPPSCPASRRTAWSRGGGPRWCSTRCGYATRTCTCACACMCLTACRVVRSAGQGAPSQGPSRQQRRMGPLWLSPLESPMRVAALLTCACACVWRRLARTRPQVGAQEVAMGVRFAAAVTLRCTEYPQASVAYTLACLPGTHRRMHTWDRMHAPTRVRTRTRACPA